ncbi:MAG TPA: hypothetical protein VJN18_24180 [Polyangiaceae bacterium]|nr:hypothetical protein [Polyangiaceae bacterium]
MRHAGWLLTLLVAGAAGCARKQEAPRRTEPWLASASASSSPAPRGILELHFSPESQIRFSLPARKAKLVGQVPLAEGKLRLDPKNLQASQASISADLTRIAISDDSLPTGGDAPPGSPSALALNWLELGPDVPAQQRTQFSLARFELVSLENLSKASLDLDASARKTPVRATAVGTLLVHGYRAPVRAEVVLELLPPSAAQPARLSIRSTTPLVLPLAPHDIVARGASGMLDPLQTARAADVVGKNARIELQLVAEASK